MGNRFRKGLSLLLAAVFSLALAFALPGAAGADDSGDTAGTTKEAVTFSANAGNSGGYFTLFAAKGTAYVSDFNASGRFTGYKSEDAFGFFRILVTKPGYEKTILWTPSATLNTYEAETGQSLVVYLPYAGTYSVVVTPLDRQEINGSFLPQNRFQYWITDASWIISRSSNCVIGAAAPGDSQSAVSGSVSVYCYDIARNYIQTYTEPVTASTTIYPKEISGYKAASSGQYIAFSNGECNPATVFFYYMKESAYGSVTVYCYDAGGQLIRQYTETVTESRTVYPQAISGYNVASSGQYVSFSNGSCSPATVTFSYQKIQQGPAALTVNCYDENGSFLRSYTEQVAESRTVYPQALSGYEILSSGQYVSYSNGACTPSSVAFSYRKVQQMLPATVTITCFDENGNAIRSYTEQLSDSKTFYPPSVSGYNAASPGQYVSYTGSGTCYPASISFNYTKAAQPAPVAPQPQPQPQPQSQYQPQPGSRIAPGNNPRMAYPYAWDTQFKPGTATHQSGTNARNYDKLWTMYDDSAGSSFFWVIYQVETLDNIPEFTAFFDENTSISSIGIRNGNLLNTNTYTKYARVRRFEVWIYDKEENVYKTELVIPDGYSQDYREFPLGTTYNDVTRVEFWITGTADYYYGRDEGTNVCHLADIAFFKY